MVYFCTWLLFLRLTTTKQVRGWRLKKRKNSMKRKGKESKAESLRIGESWFLTTLLEG
jgi:hypothetical protein